MNCMYCGKELTKKQISVINAKKRELFFCSKKCSYKSPLRGNKISSSQLGKKLSKETKEKISKTISNIMIGNTYGTGNKGNKLSQEHKQKISKKLHGHEVNQEVRNKISSSHCGKKMPQEVKDKMNKDKIGKKRPDISELMKKIKKGSLLSNEQKMKIAKSKRLQMIMLTQDRLKENEQLIPNWNPIACDYFEQFDKENNTQGKHARNGGEFYIKELGYWVDYINHDLKLIMEYDEKYHFAEKQRKKDMKRQKEIQELYPEYKFERIQEVK